MVVEEFITLENVVYLSAGYGIGLKAATIAVETVNQFVTLFKPALEVLYHSPFVYNGGELKDSWNQFADKVKKMGVGKYHYNLEFDDSGLVNSWGVVNEDLKGKMPSKFKAFPGQKVWNNSYLRNFLTSLMEEKRDYLILNFKDRSDYQIWGNIHIINEDSRAFYEEYDEFVTVNIAGFSTQEAPLYFSYGRDDSGFGPMKSHYGAQYNILAFPLSPPNLFMNWDISPFKEKS